METARRIFAEKGPDASLDEIARAAGVGNGTLYRHFPTRGALVDAVCHDDARALILAAARVAEDNTPVEALLRWMDIFIDHVAARNIVVEAVTALVTPAAANDDGSGLEVRAALIALSDRAIEAGLIQCDGLDPLDLLRAIAGLAVISPKSDWSCDAKRLVQVIIAGLQEPLRPR